MNNKIACVYLTIYRGNKLPSFYIGSAWTKNIEKGYRGSVSNELYKSIWKNELKVNPHLFKTHIIKYCGTRDEAYSEEARLQVKLNILNNCLYINQFIQGITHTDETRKKISDTLKGKCYTSTNSRIEGGRKRTGMKRPYLYKQIAQYNDKGELVKTFDNAYQAAKHTNLLQGSIVNALSGKCKHHGGYYWRYTSDEINKAEFHQIKEYKPRKGNYKVCKIAQMDTNHNILHTFNSLKEAAHAIGGVPSNICSGIKTNGIRYGYKWNYLEDCFKI